jgi:hypothetical protein
MGVRGWEIGVRDRGEDGFWLGLCRDNDEGGPNGCAIVRVLCLAGVA